MQSTQSLDNDRSLNRRSGRTLGTYQGNQCRHYAAVPCRLHCTAVPFPPNCAIEAACQTLSCSLMITCLCANTEPPCAEEGFGSLISQMLFSG